MSVLTFLSKIRNLIEILLVKRTIWYILCIFFEQKSWKVSRRGCEAINTTTYTYSESVATLPPFSPIEGQKWFDQISIQWESQKNRFALTYFGKIQFLPPCIWNLPFMSTASGFVVKFIAGVLYIGIPLKELCTVQKSPQKQCSYFIKFISLQEKITKFDLSQREGEIIAYIWHLKYKVDTNLITQWS